MLGSSMAAKREKQGTIVRQVKGPARKQGARGCGGAGGATVVRGVCVWCVLACVCVGGDGGVDIPSARAVQSRRQTSSPRASGGCRQTTCVGFSGVCPNAELCFWRSTNPFPLSRRRRQGTHAPFEKKAEARGGRGVENNSGTGKRGGGKGDDTFSGRWQAGST